MSDLNWRDRHSTGEMLESLKGRGTERQLRLFAAACCRAIWHFLSDKRSQQAVEMAERFAEGGVEERDLKEAYIAADAAASLAEDIGDETAYHAALAAAWAAIEPAYCDAAYAASHAAFYAQQAGGESQVAVQEIILTELFGREC